MSKKVPSIELVILLVFFLSFSVWAFKKCSATKEATEITAISDAELPQVSDIRDTLILRDTIVLKNSENVRDSLRKALAEQSAVLIQDSSAGRSTIVREVARPVLYITIDGLKLRSGPSLDSAVVARLPLFEEVIFMDKVTDFKQEINLGLERANEPWVMVKTKSGQVGWVYGAGVHYHRKEREGVL